MSISPRQSPSGSRRGRPKFTVHLIGGCNGVSLIELLVAVTLTVAAVVGFSLMFPRVSRTVVNTRVRSIANNLALGKLQQLQSEPYPLLPLTAATAANFPAGAVDPGGCDCQRADFSVLPDSDAVVVDGNTYTRHWCVDYLTPGVGGVWIPSCATDNTYKGIVVQVSWRVGNSVGSTNAQGLVTRF